MINLILGVSVFLNVVLIVTIVTVNKHIEESNATLEYIIKKLKET